MGLLYRDGFNRNRVPHNKGPQSYHMEPETSSLKQTQYNKAKRCMDMDDLLQTTGNRGLHLGSDQLVQTAYERIVHVSYASWVLRISWENWTQIGPGSTHMLSGCRKVCIKHGDMCACEDRLRILRYGLVPLNGS